MSAASITQGDAPTSTTQPAATATATTASTTTYTSTSTDYNLGPLTTTWTAPSDCNKAWLDCLLCDDAYRAQTCYESGSAWQDDPTCWPSITLTPSGTASTDDGMYYSTYGYYSPGIICPAGYTTACAMQGGTDGVASTVSGSQRFNFDYTPTVGETAVGCCPTGYACADSGDQSCTLQIASTTASFLQCTTGSLGSILSTVLSLPATYSSTGTYDSSVEAYTSYMTEMVMWAPLYQLNYQATDLPASTSSFSSSSSSSSSSSPPATSSSSSSSSSHTSTIAAAVAVPVVVVALAAAGLGWFWWRRRARQQQIAYEPAHPHSPGPVEMSEQTIPYEMSAADARIELPGAKLSGPPEGIVHEMDGSGHN